MVLMIPAQSQAFLGLSFDILSFGPFSLGIDIPLKRALPLLGAISLVGAVISYFSRSGGGSSYAASYPNAAPLTRHVKLTINPEDHYKKMPLRIRLNHYKVLDDNNRIPLNGNGYLEVQYETGKMIFRDADFEGYMLFHYDRSLSVWDTQDNPVLVLTLDEKKLMIIQEKSASGSEVLQLLLGGKK
ncbi:hypothetical protein QUF75_16800 [Desulfococcaceae bacterium HSG7]|nr:hypothetical protein [Desulfococcaceae bacterium HSG7]